MRLQRPRAEQVPEEWVRATRLRIACGENVKVTQELMRHSHSKTTLDIYAKAVTPSKRRAHERIVDGLLAAADRNVGFAAQAEIAIVG